MDRQPTGNESGFSWGNSLAGILFIRETWYRVITRQRTLTHDQNVYECVYQHIPRLLKYIWYLNSRNHTCRICRCCTLHFETSQDSYDEGGIWCGNS